MWRITFTKIPKVVKRGVVVGFGLEIYDGSTSRDKFSFCEASMTRDEPVKNMNTKLATSTTSIQPLSGSTSMVDLYTKSSDDVNIKPVLEATTRAFRLIHTVLMIILEYKLEQCKEPMDNILNAWGFDAEFGDAKMKKLEKSIELLSGELQEAQRKYARADEDPLQLPNDELKTRKEQRRLRVLDTAKRLGEAEKELNDYMESLNNGTNDDKDMTIHARAARRLRDLCRKNGGTYIKVGQHLANLDHLLPPAYITTLHCLFGEAPVTKYEDVREVVKEELGQYPEDLFEYFEVEPIASASLAQVHIAKEKNTGKKLAIKVQHRGLRETSKGDLIALETMVRLIDDQFDEFKWGWICDEIAPNLPKELDFTHEGKNAEEAAMYLKESGLRCVVPKVHWNVTTERVLVMDFEEGHSVTNLKEIERKGVNKKELANLISSVFQSQIFKSGHIHCDPHAENVFWRVSESGKPELVLFDHGLYKQIDDEFRITYANLWKSLLVADIEGIQKSCSKLGVEEMYPLLAAMLTSRPFDEVIERNKTKSFKAKESMDTNADTAMIRGYAQQYLKEIIQMLDMVPRQMLLLFKMNDCLRHIDTSLGSPVNNIVIAGKFAAQATYEHECNNVKGMKRLGLWIRYRFLRAKISLFERLKTK